MGHVRLKVDFGNLIADVIKGMFFQMLLPHPRPFRKILPTCSG